MNSFAQRLRSDRSRKRPCLCQLVRPAFSFQVPEYKCTKNNSHRDQSYTDENAVKLSHKEPLQRDQPHFLTKFCLDA